MREFLTYKSGKFYFSDHYDAAQIDSLLAKATVLSETIADLPILPEIASQIQPDIMYSSIAGTAAIEGNPIPSEDVKKIAHGEEVSGYTRKAQQEIKNLVNAYNLLAGIEPCDKPFVVTESLLRDMHKIITADINDGNNIPGQYRNGIVHVGDAAHGGVYTPPKILEDIKNLMKEFVDWINSEEVLHLNPFIRATLAHYYFCVIHPFWDGNGRTSRLLEAAIMQSANIKFVPRELSNYYYRNVDDYYNSFSQTIQLKKDATPFIKFSISGSVESLYKIKETIIYFIRKFSLRDFYRLEKENKKITNRQFELLNLLLDDASPFTLKDLLEKRPFSILYNNVTTQTARRDLKKLAANKLLVVDEKNNYWLNLRLLG